MEFLRFIFSSFWVWLGFVIMLLMIGGGVIELAKACKRNRKVKGYRIGQSWQVEIEDASKEDAQTAIMSAAYGGGCAGENGEEEEPCTNRE